MANATIARDRTDRAAVAIKKHKAAPAKFGHVLRTYGLTTKKLNELKKKFEQKDHVSAPVHAVLVD